MQRPFALLLASLWLLACSGAGKETLPEELEPGEDDSGIVEPDAPVSDTGGVGFDVSDDTNIDDGALTADTACATTEAAAVKPPVDIIMVVDQSGSMSNEIANVKANINKLSDFLKKTGLDYRVVMIGTKGTSTYQLCVPPPLGVGSPTCDSNPPLLRVVNRNVQSLDALKIILDTYDSPPGSTTAWADFLRKEALKVFVPVTDDDSRSTYPTATTFDTQLLAKPGGQFGTAAKRNYTFYSICGAQPSPNEASKCSTAVNNGAQYVALSKLTKGTWFPVCSTDYGPIFEEMGKSIATRVACEFAVPKPPEGETLDPDKVNISYTPGTPGGTTEEILKDDSKPCEGGANGWQYNADKTKIFLCGDACKKVQADFGAKVNVQFGCETKVKPPA